MNDRTKKIIALVIIFTIFGILMIIAFIKNHNKHIEESTTEANYAQNASNPNVMDSTTEEISTEAITEESFNTTLPNEYTSADNSLHYSDFDTFTIDQANSINDLNDIIKKCNKNKLMYTTIKDIKVNNNEIFEDDQKFDIINATITYGTEETTDVVIIYNSDTKDFVRYEKAEDYNKYKTSVSLYDDIEDQ